VINRAQHSDPSQRLSIFGGVLPQIRIKRLLRIKDSRDGQIEARGGADPWDFKNRGIEFAKSSARSRKRRSRKDERRSI